MKTLTVFTPTYNRANTLFRTYESLCLQTCSDFEWLIVDDGSSDETKELVSSWIAERKISIRYMWKKNGGLHTGYNTAIKNINTELCVCVDSDDWMPEDAVDIIIEEWKRRGSNGYSGIIGLDFTPDGKQVGNDLPSVSQVHVAELMSRYQNTGDRKIVMRTDLLKQVFPQPTFDGERNFNPIYLILKIDQLHPFLVLNKNLCYVDYQQDGMSANIFNQYFNSPRSFVELRRLYVSLNHTTFLWRLKQYIHLVANCKIAKINPYKLGTNNFLITALYPLGILLYYYLTKKRTQ